MDNIQTFSRKIFTLAPGVHINRLQATLSDHIMKQSLFILLFSLMALSLAAQPAVNEQGLYLDENNDPFTGIFKEEYSDGQIKLEIEFKEGLLDGKYTLWFENGQVNEVRFYKAGLKEKIWRTYNKQGIEIAEAGFLNNQKHGKWLIWDDTGSLRYDMYFREGKRSGVWKIYNEKGEIISSKDYDEEVP
jgi:antitoxin component YwqK of YwqJK toxin-antitoxin module